MKINTIPILILVSLVALNAAAVEEIEPNESLHSATYANGAVILSGTFSDSEDRDLFLINPYVNFRSRLRATARIVSGSGTGSELFSFSVRQTGEVPGEISENSVGTGEGYRLYDPPEREVSQVLPLYIDLRSSSFVAGSRYEVRLEMISLDREKPWIRFRRQKKKSNGTAAVTVFVVDNQSEMKKIVIKAPGNRAGVVMINGPSVRTKNISNSLPERARSSYRPLFQFRYRGERARVRVIAKDGAGNRAIQRLRF